MQRLHACILYIGQGKGDEDRWMGESTQDLGPAQMLVLDFCFLAEDLDVATQSHRIALDLFRQLDTRRRDGVAHKTGAT
jgi:hypothetical protein